MSATKHTGPEMDPFCWQPSPSWTDFAVLAMRSGSGRSFRSCWTSWSPGANADVQKSTIVASAAGASTESVSTTARAAARCFGSGSSVM